MPESKVTLTFHTKEVNDKISDASSKKMLEAVNEVRNMALKTLSGGRSGITYKVPGTQRTYTASAPGEPPAQATAELRQSVATRIEGEGRKVIGYVGTDKIQGRMTEFGTRYMEPRPWLRVSFEKSVPKIKQIFGLRWF